MTLTSIQYPSWTHLLSLQFLLLPPLPLLVINFADLDVSLFLHAHRELASIFHTVPHKNKKLSWKLVDRTRPYLFCLDGFHVKPLGKPVKARQTLKNPQNQEKTTTVARVLRDTHFQFSVWYISFLWNLVRAGSRETGRKYKHKR